MIIGAKFIIREIASHLTFGECTRIGKRQKIKLCLSLDSIWLKIVMNISTLENIEYIKETFKDIDNLLLIREKQFSNFNEWDKISFHQDYWIKGRIEGLYCEQEIISFHLNYGLNASICSNLKKKIEYRNFEEVWNKLKQFKCDLKDSNKPLTI